VAGREQTRIDRFAEAIDDPQWIHVDPVRARDGPFGTTIAHGFLTLSLLSRLFATTFALDNRRMGINYGLNKVRFTAAPAGYAFAAGSRWMRTNRSPTAASSAPERGRRARAATSRYSSPSGLFGTTDRSSALGGGRPQSGEERGRCRVDRLARCGIEPR
jgi:hypothetical protein